MLAWLMALKDTILSVKNGDGTRLVVGLLQGTDEALSKLTNARC